jgi:hypothetical protein
MIKLATNLITEDYFWQIVNESNLGETLTEALQKLTEEQLIGYCYWFSYYMNKTYDQALWAVAYVIFGGCSDDSFEYFRAWLLFQGRNLVFKALADPDSLCDYFAKIPEGEYPEFEEGLWIPEHVFTEKFNKDFYQSFDEYDFKLNPLPDLDFAWSEEDADSIRKVCPRTFDTWWDNSRF